MTLEEVLLVFGGHVGLLIYSLQEDGRPTPVRGETCLEAPWGRRSFSWVGSGWVGVWFCGCCCFLIKDGEATGRVVTQDTRTVRARAQAS